MQVPDTPPKGAESISGAVGAVRKDAAVAVVLAATVMECRVSARNTKASSPLPWITVIALR